MSNCVLYFAFIMTPNVSITAGKSLLTSNNQLFNRCRHPRFIVTVKFDCLQGEKVSIACVILSVKSEASSSSDPSCKTEFQSCEVNHRPKAAR